jgi:hypothetical protein
MRENERRLAELSRQVGVKKGLLGELQEEIDRYKPMNRSNFHRSAQRMVEDPEQLLMAV